MRPASEIALFMLSAVLLVIATAYFYTTAPEVASRPVSLLAAANATTGSAGSPSANTALSTSTYQYKIASSIDPCTLATLGSQGWKAVAYGSNPDTGDTITIIPGRDEDCKNWATYPGLLWAIFELSTSSTDTALTTDTASALQYKIVQNIDPCTFNTLGAQGWHALEFGSNLQNNSGRDEACKNFGIYSTLDWALFARPIR